MLYSTPASPDNEAIRELRDEMKDLNKTIKAANQETDRHSNILVRLTFILFFVAVLQLLASIGTLSISNWDKVLIIVGMLLVIGYAVKMVGKEKF